MIVRNLIITAPLQPDTLDVHPRGDGCEQILNHHVFFLTTEAAGFTYQICGRCGTVRISEKHG